ncbi:hypothetical protein TNCV_1559841 [Trichonephila clavipes]|nr:hypothetical protein TNCV_1559841 [Trichonephila clavipes]
MFDSSSYVNPTPLAHADASRDVLPRGALFSYTRASSDRLRNLEPWSSDEDDTCAGTPPRLTATPAGGRLSS